MKIGAVLALVKHGRVLGSWMFDSALVDLKQRELEDGEEEAEDEEEVGDDSRTCHLPSLDCSSGKTVNAWV
jgi:hypothetical protein